MNKMRKFMFALLSFFSLGMMAQQTQVAQRFVQVKGEAVVSAPVDIARIGVKIQHTDTTPALAKRQNDDKVKGVLAYLREAQKKHDFKFNTQRISLEKEYSYNRSEDTPSKFVASQNVEIQLKDLNFYDELMLRLLDWGITEIKYVLFERQETESLQSEARKKALQNAYQKAQEYAQVSGAKVGKVLQISEFFGNGFNGVTGVALRNTMPDSVAPKNFEISAQISVSYELVNP